MTTSVHILPSESVLPEHWFPLDDRDYGFRDQPLTLARGTKCIDRETFWEVLGGPHDGIRFAAGC